MPPDTAPNNRIALAQQVAKADAALPQIAAVDTLIDGLDQILREEGAH